MPSTMASWNIAWRWIYNTKKIQDKARAKKKKRPTCKDNRKPDRVTIPALIFICLLPVLYINKHLFDFRGKRVPAEIVLPRFVDLSEYPPFEPDVTRDFNVGTDSVPKIPRIIHQTWKDTRIPPKFVDGIKSYAKHNPNWEYFLWTDDTARDFIVDNYPELLPVWDGYLYKKDKIRRADAIRYVALYHFGGLYSDMDTLNYRSLDNAITRHACVFTPEPYEHAVSRGYTGFLINNAVMMCAPKHPFLKFLVDNLAAWSDLQELGDATGPGFLTTQYKLYHDVSREPDLTAELFNETYRIKPIEDTTPYFRKGNIALTDPRSVYIANTHYFMHTLDENSFQPLFDMCMKFHELTHLQKRACVSAKRQGLRRDIQRYAFIDHKWHLTYAWYNFYSYMPAFNYLFSTDIDTLVPHYKIYQKNSEN